MLQSGGIETTTGPLGQGISTAVGMALAERILNARFGDDLVDHYTYVIASDGDLMEGISHEASSFAGHLGLSKLIVLWDDNQISIDGPTSLSFTDDTLNRFRAYGWDVREIDGHNPQQIHTAIEYARTTDAPSLIACKTIIGYGAPTKGGTHHCHGSPLGADEIKAAREKLAWTHEHFIIPEEITSVWRSFGQRGVAERENWEARLNAAGDSARTSFNHAFSGDMPPDFDALIDGFKAKISAEKPKLATRVASGNVLDVLVPAIPELIGGSADLTPSNNTRVKNTGAVQRDNFNGRYVHFGVREHGMAAAMNGMALHGGIIPYGGTFLTFSDYCRPAIRLAALMKCRTIFIMTHDSIGLGEDGPTHQPVEHVPALAHDPQPAGLPPGRRGRDGGMLGHRAEEQAPPVAARADPPESGDGPDRAHRPKTCRPRAAISWRPPMASGRSPSSPPAPRSRSPSTPAKPFRPRASAPPSSRCRAGNCSKNRTRLTRTK